MLKWVCMMCQMSGLSTFFSIVSGPVWNISFVRFVPNGYIYSSVYMSSCRRFSSHLLFLYDITPAYSTGWSLIVQSLWNLINGSESITIQFTFTLKIITESPHWLQVCWAVCHWMGSLDLYFTLSKITSFFMTCSRYSCLKKWVLILLCNVLGIDCKLGLPKAL